MTRAHAGEGACPSPSLPCPEMLAARTQTFAPGGQRPAPALIVVNASAEERAVA